jgi:hypothetical protein
MSSLNSCEGLLGGACILFNTPAGFGRLGPGDAFPLDLAVGVGFGGFPPAFQSIHLVSTWRCWLPMLPRGFLPFRPSSSQSSISCSSASSRRSAARTVVTDKQFLLSNKLEARGLHPAKNSLLSLRLCQSEKKKYEPKAVHLTVSDDGVERHWCHESLKFKQPATMFKFQIMKQPVIRYL